MARARSAAAGRSIDGAGRRRTWLVAALVGLVALLAVPGVLSVPSRTPNVPALQIGVMPDYVSAPPDGRTVFVLDPATLGDSGPGRPLDGGAYGRALSGDGAAWVSLERTLTATRDIVPGSVTVVVRDSPTGRERTRITPSGLVCCPLLSRDGTRLLVMGLEHDGAAGIIDRFTIETSEDRVPASWTLVDVNVNPVAMRLPAWSVYDTATGRLLTSTPAPAPVGEVWWNWLDPAGARLYQAVVPGWPDAPAPRPLRLVAYDTATGGAVGQLELPGVLAGWWTTPAAGDRSEVEHLTRPGLALAPDGRRLALVHADGEAVTLVDAGRLAVERTVALTRRAGLLDWLGLGARPVAAKGWFAETVRRATFAPDGRHLYLTGWVSEPGTGRGLGVQRVDLETGQVVAEALGEETVAQLTVTPDGRDLFVVSIEQPATRWDRPPHRLRRLDPATLAVRAERRFDGPHRLLDWPAGSQSP